MFQKSHITADHQIGLNFYRQKCHLRCIILCLLFLSPTSRVLCQQQTVNRFLNMILVEGGPFEMGNRKGYVMEQPVHKVILHDFYVDKYEVTVAEYKKFCDETKRKMPEAPSWGWINNHPMINITWREAHEYETWIGKRLLTEAEWEYAARGGKLSKGYTFSGSDEIDEVGWYVKNSGKKTHLIGEKGPNELGIFDLTGNAIEWCEDWYDAVYYRMTPSDNPLGPEVGATRVLRGGSFMGDRDDCRVTKRSHRNPKRSQMRIGFRCAINK